jgi:regulator of protease activity HflC (stomatin/prohibitin superfamily)
MPDGSGGVTLNGRNQLAAMVLLSSVTIALTCSQAMAQADGDAEDGADGALVFIWMIVLVLCLLMVFSLYASVVIIRPYEQGLKIILGKYAGLINPGLNFVPPFITRIIRVDKRTQVFDMPEHEVLFRDRGRGTVNGILELRVDNPQKAVFQVANYKLATVALAQTIVLRKAGELTFEELADNRVLIASEVLEEMGSEVDPWGLVLKRFEFLDMREK